VKSLAQEFKEFLLQGSLITLAIAVVMGTVFAALVKALITDILTPIIALIFGKPDFSNLSFTINSSHFLYGDFINVALTFIFTGLAVFFMVIKPFERFQKEDDSVRDCPECTSSISSAAKRCPFCTAELALA
jgi:large conductance mechanosensitive channel